MNLISLTRFFSTFVFITLFGLQGCYEQTTPGANDAITGTGENASAGSGAEASQGSDESTTSSGSGDTANPSDKTSPSSGDKASSASGGKPGTSTDKDTNTAPVEKASTTTTTAASVSPRDSVTISLHPMSQSVSPAESFTLNVSASGNKTLRYQWRKNGRVIRNAVHASYTVNNAGASDAGKYEVIVISGRRMIMSRSAHITIEADRSASLSWAPPAKRADGTPLSEDEIAAYRIYHSNDDGSIGRDYEVDPSQQRFELDNLPRGAHHFAIATVDINGMESTLSAVVTKRIL